jgi:hypothetical protein
MTRPEIKKAPSTFEEIPTLSIGEWVEVMEDHSFGMCFEGGVFGIIIALDDNLVSVCYVLDRRAEHLIERVQTD